MVIWPSGLEIISRLAPVKLYGQTYFCSDTTRFWPDKCLSSKIIRLHFAVKYMRSVLIILLLSLRWRFYIATPGKWKTTVTARRAGLLKFCAVAEPWNSGKSGKSCEIHKNTRNIAQFGRNLTEYMSFRHIWEFRLMELFFAVHFQIYLETSSLQRENIPKLQGVLRLLWQKTGLWPVHDIKSFAIDTFLSSLLLKK